MDPIVHKLTVRNLEEGRRELAAVGADPYSHPIMAPKTCHLLIKIKDLDIKAANVLKQEMLAKGGEAAVSKAASMFTEPATDVVLMGTVKQYRYLLKNLKMQPHGLKKLIGPIELILSGLGPKVRKVDCAGRQLTVGERTLVMGILNVTPDSFSEGGLFFDKDKAVDHGLGLIDEGADIIDVGGESTRPGAAPVDADEEIRRVVPVIEALAGQATVPISVDTAKAAVAAAAIGAGAAIVNDVTALGGDESLARLCAEAGVGVVLMHMKGDPGTMQENPDYDDLISEIVGFLGDRAALAAQAGIDQGRLFIDPGIGFGKTVAHNLEILKRLAEFTSLGLPLVLGVSRKSTIGRVLGGLPAEERLEGTAAAVTAAILNGADIIRVHDVKAMARVARMTDAIAQGARWNG